MPTLKPDQRIYRCPNCGNSMTASYQARLSSYNGGDPETFLELYCGLYSCDFPFEQIWFVNTANLDDIINKFDFMYKSCIKSYKEWSDGRSNT